MNSLGVPRRSWRNFAGPVLIAVATLCMLTWSWGTWPDPLVDFGAQLYVPWRITAGQVLYRDLAYYNGPLSSYFNAAMFRLFGMGISTLVWTNLLILVAAMALVYRLALRVSGPLAATMCGLSFAMVFAFSRVVPIGNYNWIAPYTHEIVHGTVLGLATISTIARYQRTGKSRWLITAGLLLGCTLLTKAEPTAATLLAVFLLCAGGWWTERITVGRIGRDISILVGFTLLAPMVAFALMSLSMPTTAAIRAVLGSWPWVFDRRITSLQFYRIVSGLDDSPGNLRIVINWSLIYLALLGGGACFGWLSRRQRNKWIVPIAMGIACGILFLIRFDGTDWSGTIRPLPLVLAVCFVLAFIGLMKRRPLAPLQLALVGFSGVLIAKMGLKAFPYHYGFVLAMPGTMVLICLVAEQIPAWIRSRGGNGKVVQTIGLAAWLTAVGAIVHLDFLRWASATVVVAPGTSDQFCGDDHAAEIVQLCRQIKDRLPDGGTLVVLPQGLMVNYLMRMPNPSRTVNFMAPEVLAVGEENVLLDLKRHPPDAIVLDRSAIRDGSFTLDDCDPYGSNTLRWVMENYLPADPGEAHRRLRLMLRRK